MLAQRVVVRTQGGALRPAWACVYEALLRSVAAALRRAARSSGAYASGSLAMGSPVYGISDLDLVVVTPDDPAGERRNAGAARTRWLRVTRFLPPLKHLFDVSTYEQSELARAAAASALTHGLDRPTAAPYAGTRPSDPAATLQEGPGLYGPTAGWRHLAGPNRLPPEQRQPAEERSIRAWLHVQFLWQCSFRACLTRDAPWVPYFAAKLVAEHVRGWLWLTRGERVDGRVAALRRGLHVLPEEEIAIRRALELDGRLDQHALPSLAELLPAFVRGCERIARRLSEEAAEAPAVSVRLLGGDEDELLVPTHAKEDLSSLLPAGQPVRLLPLADWRARAWLWRPDEAFAPVGTAPGDPAAIATAARADSGSYAALSSGDLLVMPTARLAAGRGRLRAAQCSVTDPVSRAVVRGSRVADFPALRGWSARDGATRAVEEHRAWLAAVREDDLSLARPLNAARAALFLESLDATEPALPVTMAATAEMLADRDPRCRAAVEDGYAAYRDAAREARPEHPGAARALRAVVRRLPPYERAGAA